MTQEDALKERPFGRCAQLIVNMRRAGYDAVNVFGLSVSDFVQKLNNIDKNDILISMGFKPGIFAALFKKIKPRMVIHDWADAYAEIQASKNIATRLLFPLFDLLEKYIIESSDFVITHSMFNKNKAEKLGKNTKYIPNGVDKKIFANLDGEKIKRNYDKPIVLYIGGIANFKNTQILTKAVDGLDCCLLIIGAYSEKFKKNIPNNAFFLGEKRREKIPPYVDAAEICCSPVDWDGNLKVCEYLYLGKPIITITGKPELIFKNRENALICKPTVPDFRNGIKELLNNQSLREKISRNARKFKIYDWSELAKIYVEEIKKACST